VYHRPRFFISSLEANMKIKVIIHRPHHRHARSRLSGREFPALPGCYTQGDTYDELMRNIHKRS